MDTSTAPVLIDVRLEEDYLAAHLPGAKNNCVYEVSFSERMIDVAPRKDIAGDVRGPRRLEISRLGSEK